MKKYITRFGLYSSLMIVALFLLTWLIWGYSLPYRTQEVMGYLSMTLSLNFIFFGIKAYRDEVNGGTITFGKALKLGSLITLLPSAAFGIYMIVFFYLYGAQWTEYAMTNMPEEQKIQFQQAPEIFMNPFFQGLIMFVTVFIVGFIISLISAFILKKENKVETAQ